MESVTYRPLASDEFRLLTVHPGFPEDPIECQLRNVPLGEYSVHPEGIYRWTNDWITWKRPATENGGVARPDLEWLYSMGSSSKMKAIDPATLPKFYGPTPSLDGLSVVPEFEALSYTWGRRDQTRTIRINGENHEVTSNLFAALARLRLLVSSRDLWVDAICINQSDFDERASQVAKMRDIYQRAQGVLVWLGPESQDSTIAMRCLSGLGGAQIKELVGEWHAPQYDPMVAYGKSAASIRTELVRQELAEASLLAPSELDEAHWLAIERLLLHRSYWNRVWVVQEIVLARKVTIVCGPAELDWTVFRQDGFSRRRSPPEWEGLFGKDLFTINDSSELPPHADFLWTLLKGQINGVPSDPNVPWRRILYDKYLVWSGRVELDDTPSSILFPHVPDMEEMLLDKVPGWKIAIVEGRMSMVPSRAQEDDIVAVLFGADVPLTLRPVQGSPTHYELLGAAYVHGIMRGQVIEEFREGRRKKEVFCLV